MITFAETSTFAELQAIASGDVVGFAVVRTVLADGTHTVGGDTPAPEVVATFDRDAYGSAFKSLSAANAGGSGYHRLVAVYGPHRTFTL